MKSIISWKMNKGLQGRKTELMIACKKTGYEVFENFILKIKRNMGVTFVYTNNQEGRNYGRKLKF